MASWRARHFFVAGAHGKPAGGPEGDWELPEMTPGAYSLCEMPPGQLDRLVAQAGNGFRCVAGLLDAGGELVLEIKD
jgi:hypothetical protein